MVSVIAFLELIQIVLNFIIGPGWIIIWIMNVPILLTYFLWFKIKGVDFSPRRALNLGGWSLMEMVPIFNAFPCWTFAVIRIIRSSWAEENAERAAQTEAVAAKIGPSTRTEEEFKKAA